MTLGLIIPDVETLHSLESWVATCYPVVGPTYVPANVNTPIAHYTAAIDLPDGDLGEFITDLPGYLRAINKDYWDNRVGSGIYTCASRKPGYAIGYSFAVDWLGGVWELRGFKYLPAATKDHNTNSLPILFLVDGADGATDLAMRSARAVWREARRRSGRTDFKQRPLGHSEVCFGCTACPGSGIIRELHAGLMDLDADTPPPEDEDMKFEFYPDTDPSAHSYDSRVPPPGDKLQAGVPRTIPMPRCQDGSIPVGAVITLTAVEGAQPGWMAVYPGEYDGSSCLNYQVGQAIANTTTVKLSATGTFDVLSSQAAHVVIDVVGLYHA